MGLHTQYLVFHKWKLMYHACDTKVHIHIDFTLRHDKDSWTTWPCLLSFIIFWQLFLLNYFYTINQYKCNIHYVLSYGILYWHFCCKLYKTKVLIEIPSDLKSFKSSIHHRHIEHQSARASTTSLNYIILFRLFRLVV